MGFESAMNSAKRFVRENITGDIFVYDPTFTDPNTPWKKMPDGRIVVGPAQVHSALAIAKALDNPDAATVVGLSKTYIEQNFPEALN